MTSKRKRSPERATPSPPSDIYRSAPIKDRQSTFIAYYSPTLKPKDLQQLAEFQSASHKILGWRRPSNQQSINKSLQYVKDSDDDGEKNGGRHVEKVLDSMQAVGSLVVARWYGGVMLGPVRFDHMETCAREAILQYQEREAEDWSKKRRLEEEESERKRLAVFLGQRDESINTLRTLAQEKERMVRDAIELETKADHEQRSGSQSLAVTPASTSAPAPAPAAKVEYESMPLVLLQALEKARDATLGFLLKRINQADAKLAKVPTSENPGKD